MARAKKELDSELNLISFVSLLSVLICSLLLTAIWVHIGSMDVKQAVGGQGGAASTKEKKPPAVWANLAPDGSIRFVLQDFPKGGKAYDNRQIPGVVRLRAVIARIPRTLFGPSGDSMLMP